MPRRQYAENNSSQSDASGGPARAEHSRACKYIYAKAMEPGRGCCARDEGTERTERKKRPGVNQGNGEKSSSYAFAFALVRTLLLTACAELFPNEDVVYLRKRSSSTKPGRLVSDCSSHFVEVHATAYS